MESIPDMIVAKEDFALVYDQSISSIDGYRLFAIGGFNQSYSVLHSIEMYCSQSQEWTQIASFNDCNNLSGRRAHRAIALPDAVYIMGGFDGSNYLNELLR